MDVKLYSATVETDRCNLSEFQSTVVVAPNTTSEHLYSIKIYLPLDPRAPLADITVISPGVEVTEMNWKQVLYKALCLEQFPLEEQVDGPVVRSTTLPLEVVTRLGKVDFRFDLGTDQALYLPTELTAHAIANPVIVDSYLDLKHRDSPTATNRLQVSLRWNGLYFALSRERKPLSAYTLEFEKTRRLSATERLRIYATEAKELERLRTNKDRFVYTQTDMKFIKYGNFELIESNDGAVAITFTPLPLRTLVVYLKNQIVVLPQREGVYIPSALNQELMRTVHRKLNNMLADYACSTYSPNQGIIITNLIGLIRLFDSAQGIIRMIDGIAPDLLASSETYY